MLRSLTSLRGLFALIVFLCHYRVDGVSLMPWGGDGGVAFFIMLSGFVLTLSYGDRLASGSVTVREFLQRRLRRIYPPHLLCFVAAAAIVGGGKLAALANLLLVQSWVPVAGFYFSFNAVSWFLSDLVFFYVVFLFGAKQLNNLGYKQLCVFVAICVIYVAAIPSVPENLRDAVVYVCPLTRLLDFSIGVLLARLYRLVVDNGLCNNILRKTSAWQKTMAEVCAVALYGLAAMLWPAVESTYGLSALWWLPAAVLLMTFAVLEKGDGYVTKLLHTPLLQWFGSVSFGFFLVHWLAIRAVGRAALWADWNPVAWVMFALTFGFTLTVAVVFHQIFGRK